MITKKRLCVSMDPELIVWVKQRSISLRRGASGFIEQLLAAAKKRQPKSP